MRHPLSGDSSFNGTVYRGQCFVKLLVYVGSFSVRAAVQRECIASRVLASQIIDYMLTIEVFEPSGGLHRSSTSWVHPENRDKKYNDMTALTCEYLQVISNCVALPLYRFE